MKKILNQFPFIRVLLLKIRHRLWAARTKKNLKSYLSGNDCPMLQLGAGQNVLKGWFNTDYFPRQSIYFLDVTKPFPLPSNSFKFIFTEHHIEHITYRDAVSMLKECFRILEPGGLIRIVTPDLKNTISNYLNGSIYNEEVYSHSKEYICSGFYNAVTYVPVDDYLDAHIVNDTFLNYEHKFIYDFESLKRVLEHAGFGNVKDCGQKASVYNEFLNIETHNGNCDKYFSLSIEAEKI